VIIVDATVLKNEVNSLLQTVLRESKSGGKKVQICSEEESKFDTFP